MTARAASPRRSVAPPGPGDDVGVLPGVTARRRELFLALGVATVEDLLRLAPRRHEDRRRPTPIAALVPGQRALVVARVVSSRAFRLRGGLSILEAVVRDESGTLAVRWFHRGFVARAFAAGRLLSLYGDARLGTGRRVEMVAPAHEVLEEDGGPTASTGRLVPVHPLTPGLTAQFVRRTVWSALPAAAAVADPVPPATRDAAGLPPLCATLRALHFPEDEAEAERARSRLAFEELLVHQVMLTRRRADRRRETAPAFRFPAALHERIRRRLPFDLTPAQRRAVADVVADLSRPHPMSRLLQGDVGSGKTAVAVYALLAAVANGVQAAFVAPTEVLARQHEGTLGRLLAGSRVRCATLTGALRGAERAATLDRVARGEVDLVIGTHAVLSEDVRFARLGLVVVDEQHRFGVRQRQGLLDREPGSPRPHALVMTATPIPRTLALAVYGDLDVSVIEGRPPGRGPVETWVVDPADGARVMERVREELAKGRQAFVIFPLVEATDSSARRDATQGAERWRKALPDVRVALLHGRLPRKEKDAAMDAFRRGEVRVLVATVVVEVGIDVPNATVLVVEHAERFGLSQLHQLRGRVGRGEGGGLCVLVDRSEGRSARLDVLARTEDGFAVAEEDLRLRGTGDLFGTRQHGRPTFRAATLPRDLPWLARAREAADALLARDPGLAAPEHVLLRAVVAAREREAVDPSIGG